MAYQEYSKRVGGRHYKPGTDQYMTHRQYLTQQREAHLGRRVSVEKYRAVPDVEKIRSSRSRDKTRTADYGPLQKGRKRPEFTVREYGWTKPADPPKRHRGLQSSRPLASIIARDFKPQRLTVSIRATFHWNGSADEFEKFTKLYIRGGRGGVIVPTSAADHEEIEPEEEPEDLDAKGCTPYIWLSRVVERDQFLDDLREENNLKRVIGDWVEYEICTLATVTLRAAL